MALLLKRLGISQVRPLAGGLEAWIERGFATEPLQRDEPTEVS